MCSPSAQLHACAYCWKRGITAPTHLAYAQEPAPMELAMWHLHGWWRCHGVECTHQKIHGNAQAVNISCCGAQYDCKEETVHARKHSLPSCTPIQWHGALMAPLLARRMHARMHACPHMHEALAWGGCFSCWLAHCDFLQQACMPLRVCAHIAQAHSGMAGVKASAACVAGEC